MENMSSGRLLKVWERYRSSPEPYRAVALLAEFCQESSFEELAALCIGQRDSHLLTLYEKTFGPRLECVTRCPKCGDHMEIALDVEGIRVQPTVEGKVTHTFQAEDYLVEFRLPNTLDVISLYDLEGARSLLFERCLLSVRRQGKEIPSDALPKEVVSSLIDEMEKVDPQADVRLALTCPSCGHSWEGIFDIVSFFLTEIESWARHLLLDVHLLARAYGWREADIISMSPTRRQFYLEMIRG